MTRVKTPPTDSTTSIRRPSLQEVVNDWSLTATVAGLIGVLVGLAGPFAIVLQAISASGASPEQTISWVWAIAVGSGVAGISLSWLTRMPVVVAWSTPGAALLISSLGGYSFSDAVGSFICASLVATVLGFTGWFGKVLALIPPALPSALLAGVLLPFIISGSKTATLEPIAVGAVVVTFLIAKRWIERYAVVLALIAGGLATVFVGAWNPPPLDFGLSGPIWTAPTFNPSALLSVGLPLLLITMTAQNAPGLTVLRNAGYTPNDRTLVGGVSAFSLGFTFFGGHAINLAAITAGISCGPEAHEDPNRRYIAGIATGLGNIVVGVFAGTVIGAYLALPTPVISALAALALIPAVLGALKVSLDASAGTQTAAILTMTTTASGLVIAGVGSAFWGLVIGVAVWFALRIT